MKNVFVTGNWRSGTSLMLRLFDAHPQTYTMPHVTGMITILEKYPEYLEKMKRCKDEYQLLGVIAQESIVNNFQHIISASLSGMKFGKSKVGYPFEFDFNVFSNEFFCCVRKQTSLNDIVYGYFNAIKMGWINCTFKDDRDRVYIQQQGQRLYKYPGEDTIRFVMENVENMVVVEMVRDPIYQISSVLKITNNSVSLEEAIVAWSYAYNHMKRNPIKYGDRYLMIKYEDVVIDRVNTMKLISSFAEIEYEDILTRPTFNGENWRANSSFDESRKEIGLTSEQIEYIEKSLGDYRKELDYPDIKNLQEAQ